MATYTVLACEHRRWDTDTDAEIICFSIKNSDGVKVFQVRIPRKLFDMLTDKQVVDYITWCCKWHKRRVVDNDVSSPQEDTTLDARADSFVDTKVVVD